MDSKLFRVSILTPTQLVYEGLVTSLIAPAYLGYMGVLANHAPIIAALIPGKIILRGKQGESKILFSKGKGFLEVLRNNAVILADSIEPSV